MLGPVPCLGQSVAQGLWLGPVPLVDAGGRPVPAKGRAVRCLNRLRDQACLPQGRCLLYRLRRLPCRQWAWQERPCCRKMPLQYLKLRQCLGPSLRQEERSLCRLRWACRLCQRQERPSAEQAHPWQTVPGVSYGKGWGEKCQDGKIQGRAVLLPGGARPCILCAGEESRAMTCMHGKERRLLRPRSPRGGRPEPQRGICA